MVGNAGRRWINIKKISGKVFKCQIKLDYKLCIDEMMYCPVEILGIPFNFSDDEDAEVENKNDSNGNDKASYVYDFINAPVATLESNPNNDLDLMCEICHKVFSRKDSLLRHKKIHDSRIWTKFAKFVRH